MTKRDLILARWQEFNVPPRPGLQAKLDELRVAGFVACLLAEWRKRKPSNQEG